jgi:hypothetical protein
MDRNQAKEFYPFLKAFADGKVIETRTDPNVVGKGLEDMNDWTEMNEIEHWNNIQYRVKPEPTYRPFKDAEECWAEMLEHQPFGWVKTKDKGIRLCMSGLNQKSAFTQVGHKYDEAFDEFTFADGTPFGVKVEE